MTADLGRWRRPAFTHSTLASLSLLMVFPVAWAVATSFRPEDELYSLDVFPARPTLDSYRQALDTLPMARLLANTAFMAAGVTAAQVLLSILAAYAFVRFDFRGRTMAFAAMVGTILVPQQVLIVPNYLLAAELGWIGTYLGLVVPQIATAAFGIFLLRQHMRSFPRALLDAAELEGATHRDVLWRIVVPNLRPAISALAILFFIASWNEYLWPLLVAQGPEDGTVQVGLQSFIGEQGTAWGRLMAAASLASLPVLAVYVVAQRQIIDAFLRAGLR